jgi:2-keto-4-pentenoate hydratase/2-oxohepta-3-ene-1,7-dioic acid hydratase in catechol pathway
VRLLRVGPVGHERPAVLAAEGSLAGPSIGAGGRLLDISSIAPEINGAFLSDGGLDRVRDALASGGLPEVTGEPRIGAPLARPGKVVCIGLNYSDHAEETGAPIPPEPVVFMKATNTVIGPNDEVLVPRRSTKTDWEVELAVVIGTTARYLESEADALACVAGYAVANDVSEREFQLERGGTWDKGKSCETFNPLGPWLVTADEVPDPQQLGLRLWVDGVQRQNGNTKNMIFSVAHVVHYLSQFMVLEPGDVINTGTPAGVAQGFPEPKPFLHGGEVLELEIDGLGRQRQTVGKA